MATIGLRLIQKHPRNSHEQNENRYCLVRFHPNRMILTRSAAKNGDPQISTRFRNVSFLLSTDLLAGGGGR